MIDIKDLSKEMKIIRFISCLISVLGVIVGLGFSYLIAQLNDAPGFVFIGTTVTLVGVSFIYGLGEIIILLKKNNDLLRELVDKKK